jgi:hypothetical protein
MAGPQRSGPAQPGTTDRGAHALGGDDGGGGRRRGLLPLILGLLAALILAAILIATCGGDDDDEAATTTPAPSAQTTPAGDGATSPQPATGGAAGEGDGDDTAAGGTGGAAAGGDGGRLVAGGQDLLPATQAPFGGDLVGQRAQGTGVRVQEVVQDEGFFVGTSEQDRVYVEFGGEVGQAEQGAQVTNELQVGDVVDLEGEVRPAPEQPGQTLNLDQADADRVREQGVFVNATEVTPQGG